MKTTTGILIGFATYVILGICPMQISMMSMDHSKMDMDGMMHASAIEQDLENDTLPCDDCLNATDHSSLQQTQILSYNVQYSVSATIPAPQTPDSLSGGAPINSAQLARAGPFNTAPSVVKTIVLRT